MIRAVNSIHRCCLLVLAPVAAPLTSLAQSQPPGEKSWHLAVALGEGRRTNPLAGGEATDINYVVDFSWYGDKFFFDNGDLGYTFTTVHNLSFGALLAFSNERNDYSFLTGRQFGLGSQNTILTGTASAASPCLGLPTTAVTIKSGDTTATGSPPVTGITVGNCSSSSQAVNSASPQNLQTSLAHRDTAINGGFELLYISPLGDIHAQVLDDVSNTHNGQTAWLSWSHPWYTTNSEVSLTLGVEWKSRKLVGYYYGVRPNEVLAGRPQYDGASGTNTSIKLAGRYHLTEHLTLAAMAEREFLSAAITASPVVTSDAVNTFFTGLFYNF